MDDDAEFHRYHAAARAAELFERPDAPWWSEAEAVVEFRQPNPMQKLTGYVAVDDGDLVGGAYVAFPLVDNKTMAWGGVFVPPEHRGNGIGSLLLGHLVDVTAAQSRTALLVEANIPFDRRDDHPYRRFAERHGFALANIEIRRDRPLPADDDWLADLADTAAPHHAGYSLEVHTEDDMPDDLLPSYCDAWNRLGLEAPTGDIVFEAEGLTPKLFRRRAAKSRAQGRTAYHAIGLDGNRRVVAYSTLAVSKHTPDTVYQWGTLVLPEHRGHRLGMAVKVHNLQTLQRHHPDAQRITTSNTEDNQAMVDINVRLGFEPVEILAEFQRRLD